jgi:glycosyltransferase involved in cell wall biosynthesis
MLIINNFQAFPEEWVSLSGEPGRSLQAKTARDFIRGARQQPDAVFLVNCDPRLTLELGAAKRMKLTSAPLVSADLVLRAPSTSTERAVLALKKPLLRQVDLFMHYFRDYRRFAQTFGVPMDRHDFIPFKVNLSQRHGDLPERPDGDYVLCFGRSLRDFDTFFAAMELVPFPGAIAKADPAQLRAHHARFTRSGDSLPANVRVLEDDGSEQAQIRILGGAKMVVLPILKSSLVASGISTCLNAMHLGKCVIGSEGPGMSDIFDEEILAVPPENPAALAAAIRRAWEDDRLRLRTARAGRAYALKAGGEEALYQRIIERISLWYGVRKNRFLNNDERHSTER